MVCIFDFPQIPAIHWSTQLLHRVFKMPRGFTPSAPARVAGAQAGTLRARIAGAYRMKDVAVFILFLLSNSVANKSIIPV